MIFNYEDNLKKPVYNWYYYKEGFSWKLIDKCIQIKKPEIIADPFVGSGTTILRAKELGIQSYGSDISPFAVFLSYTKTRNWNIDYEEPELNDEIEIPFELFPLNRAFSTENYKILKKLRYWVEKKTHLHLLALIKSAMECSYIKKDGGVLKIVKRKTPNLLDRFKHNFRKMINEKIIGPEPIVEMKSIKDFNKKADMIITSPPYLNNIDYTKVYGVELAILTLNRSAANVRGEMLNSFIKSKAEYYGEIPIVEAYFEDIKQSLQIIYDNLYEKGLLFFNISNSIINNQIIEADIKSMEIMRNIGFKDVRIVEYVVRNTKINGKLYRVRESLIVASR